MTGTRYGERARPSRASANYLTGTGLDSDAYVRPVDWPTLPALANNRLYGLVAVRNAGSNFLALKVTVTGGYTVDWGDGNVENVASGTKAEHQYTYSTLSTSVVADGFKTAIIQVYPQAANNITAIDLWQRHSGVAHIHETGWLDLAIQASAMTTLKVGYPTGAIVYFNLLQQFRLAANAVTDLSYLFYNFSGLKSVSLVTTSANAMSSMFYGCTSLRSVPLFNTAAVTDMSSMFYGCASLRSVPLFNTAADRNMSGMFSGCTSLRSVPLFNTAAVTDMSSMFFSCTSLRSVPLFNTAAVTNMSSMFSGCTSLRSVPLFNTAAVTNMSSMFYGCASLRSVPLFNTAADRNMGSMFYGCTSLRSVPLFNTAAVTDMTGMFESCRSLQEVPALNVATVTTFGSMFAVTNGNSVESAPLAGTRFGINYTNCNLSGTALDAIYTALAGLGTKACTAEGDGTTMTYTTSTTHYYVVGQLISVTGMSVAGYNVTNKVITSVGSATTFTVAGTTTGSGTGGTSNGGSAATITVSGNHGTASDTTSIATNKGWTVTG